MKFPKRFRSPTTIVYMLQNTEYDTNQYIAWLRRTKDFSRVMYRRKLEKTRRARLLLWVLRWLYLVQLALCLAVLCWSLASSNYILAVVALVLASITDNIWSFLVIVPLQVVRVLIVGPKNRRLIANSRTVFSNTKAIKIAVAGSYGKTTMKELLKTVLQEGLRVAATPGNKNVSVSHAAFATKLKGDEQVVIIEYGEGAPGDVEQFNQIIKPNIGVITGIAPAHLDKYGTVENAAKDILSLVSYVGKENAYLNADSVMLTKHIDKASQTYSRASVLGWRISGIATNVTGTDFILTKDKKSIKLHTDLIGEHLVGSVALVAVLALQLGLTKEQVVTGIAKTKPFEHRMQARALSGGWIIDDTYNGNLEGVRAGLELLSGLSAQRKIYVTPGLVDQGNESQRVHTEIGKLIARAHPDIVVLMENSVTEWIRLALVGAGFKGEVRVESDPLRFYSNIEHFIAAGDIVLMQNDWTDNYN